VDRVLQADVVAGASRLAVGAGGGAAGDGVDAGFDGVEAFLQLFALAEEAARRGAARRGASASSLRAE
jgi:hypothetical protein